MQLLMSSRKRPRMRRRDFSKAALASSALLATQSWAAGASGPGGEISGEPTAEKAGREIFAAGGNAIDAIVAAALVAAIVVPHQTGLGGYGGHLTMAVGNRSQETGGRSQETEDRTQGAGASAEKRIVSIDFNSIAPAAATADMFAPGADGKVAGQRNMYGWLAAGVPGILAGLELAQKTYGTKSLGDVMQPAIGLAREGFRFGAAAANLKTSARQLAADPASQKLYFRNGRPLAATDHYANPDAAKMLEQLARDNSVEAFYRGDVAERIAAAFAANGGLVTKADLAAYQARIVEPSRIAWGDWTLHTAPLTAGGVTTLHALLLLEQLKWAEREALAADTLALQIEAFRYAWQDRLELFGDPDKVAVPLARLLDPATIRQAAKQIEKAVADKRPLSVRVTSRPDTGTISLSAVDRQGNLAAMTLTHGRGFGARVTVPGIGVTLGHGMSRFDVHPDHPNAPGPHKRPLNNMCPTIAVKGGKPLFAIGGRGGRKIPNAVGEVLLQLVARGKDLREAVAAPRLHTEGTLAVSFEKEWPGEPIAGLVGRGYVVNTAASATISAVGLDGEGRFVTAMR